MIAVTYFSTLLNTQDAESSPRMAKLQSDLGLHHFDLTVHRNVLEKKGVAVYLEMVRQVYQKVEPLIGELVLSLQLSL